MCLTCEFFDRASTNSSYPPDGIQLGKVKGFGNANQVFEVTWESLGDPLHLVARCSRRQKEESLLDSRLALLEEEMWSRRGYQIQRDDLVADHITYVSEILAPGIGLHYLPLMMPTTNIKRFLSKEKRTILMPDATALMGMPLQKSVCLEIKPKFGSILCCDTIQDPRQRHLKHSKSRYSLHQTLKLQQGLIQAKSEYEPLDLFSRDAARMHQAIVALLQNPQNNLKAFIGGERLTCQHTMSHKVCEILFGENAQEATDMIASLVSSILWQESVLEHILAVQNKCSYDVQAVEKMLEHLIQNLSTISDEERNRILCILAEYCESATAKDCSIMITMARDDGAEGKLQDSTRPCKHGAISLSGRAGAACRYRITVVDLDRKSLAKIKSHANLDRLIMDSNTIHNDIQ